MDASGCTEYGCWDCDGALGLPVLWPYHGHWLGTSLLFFWHLFISLFKTLYGISMWDEPLLAQISLRNASVFSKKSHQEIFSLQRLLELFPSFIFCLHETGDGSTWFSEVYHYLHCQYGSKTLLLVGTYKTSTLMTGEHFSIPHCLAVPSAMVSSFTMLPEVNVHDITLLLALFLFTLLSLNSVFWHKWIGDFAGSLTKLSSLTFLTPMFATLFG